MTLTGLAAIPGLLAVIGLVLLNGFFVATQFAIVAVRRSRLRELAAGGSKPARTAEEVVRHLDVYIAACQLGITMASVRLFYLVFRWPITLLNAVGNGILRLAGLEPAAGRDELDSVEELQFLVQGLRTAGTIEASEARIASRALEFADQTAGSLMTPRIAVDAIPEDLPLDVVLDRVARTRHGHLPVYRGSLDQVVGEFDVRDLVVAMRHRHQNLSLRSLLRPLLAVPETLPADHLLERLGGEGRDLALVVDEYGGTAGVVSREDLPEALFGPSEPGLSIHLPGVIPRDGEVVLDGLTRLDDAEDLAGLQVPARLRRSVETLGGLVMACLGRAPRAGDQVAIGPWWLPVEELDGHRVASVAVSRRGAPDERRCAQSPAR